MSNVVTHVLMSGHTVTQKINFIRHVCSGRKAKVAYLPVALSIVATTRCTLSCDMCPTHSRKVPRDYPYIQRSSRDMSLEMFKEIIDRFRDALSVQIIGSGEPLLNEDFFRMVDYAASRKMSVKTFSNGTTVGAHIEEILSSKLDGITVSLNGHDAKEFARMTGMKEEAYHTISDAVRRLIDERNRRNSRLKVKLSFIVDKSNYMRIHDMAEAGLALGADHLYFCNFLPCPYEGLGVDERSLVMDEETAGRIREAVKEYPRAIRKKITLPLLIDRSLRRNRCATHFSQIRFDGDGNVSSCSMMLLDMAGHGSYRDKDVWNNEFFAMMRSNFLKEDDAYLPEPCRVCPDNKGVSIESR